MKSDIKKVAKLTLSRQTLRSLTEADLDHVVGGTVVRSLQAPCGASNVQSCGGPFPNNRLC